MACIDACGCILGLKVLQQLGNHQLYTTDFIEQEVVELETGQILGGGGPFRWCSQCCQQQLQHVMQE